MHNTVMPCPVCEGQGNIYNAKVIDLDILIKICDECEACWKENQPVTLENFKGLTTFLEENDLTYEDSTIEDLGYVQEKI
jgi:hypothetical protein